MTGKRTADAAGCDDHDHDNAKLQRVTHALENVTREGAMFKSGATERFPLPAIAFKGDHEKELRLPLDADDTQKIKARGATTETKVTRWDIAGDQLESRNAQWHVFLDETVSAHRQKLGIAPTADVTITLHKLVLAEAGARLNARDEGEVRGDGVFGTLLVVLPSTFEGGDFVVPQPPWVEQDSDEEGEGDEDELEHDDCDESEATTTWRPSGRISSYGLSYAAFYNHCEVVAEPVTSGAALCLLYDLVTTTPSDVPLFAGPEVVQRSVEMALTEFFEVAPSPLAKRFKISPDAWRSINEFAAERHFAYFVDSDSFDSLYCSDRVVAQSLAAFCAQSAGEYVLYHTYALCSRRARPRASRWIDDDDNDDVAATAAADPLDEEVRVLLKGPWTKYGESTSSAYPPIILRPRDEVAPFGDVLPFDAYHPTSAITDMVKQLYGDRCDVEVVPFFALVVLPTSIESRQMATVSMEDAMKNLRDMLSTSREEALAYARRMVHFRSDWRVTSKDMDLFEAFVDIVVDELNDLELFKDVLRHANLMKTVRRESLSSGVKKFGWDACADTMLKKLLSNSTMRCRVNLINSVFAKGVRAEHLDPLLDALMSFHPYTDVVSDAVRPNAAAEARENSPSVGDFVHLLLITHLVSVDKVQPLVSIQHPQEMVRVILPALLQVREEYEELPTIQATVQHVWDLFQAMKPEIRNDKFTKIRIPEHCATCTELQRFLDSVETQTVLQVTDGGSEATHLEMVLKKASEPWTTVRIRQEGDAAVRVSKELGMDMDFEGIGFCAKRLEKRMSEVLFPTSTIDEDQGGEDSD